MKNARIISNGLLVIFNQPGILVSNEREPENYNYIYLVKFQAQRNERRNRGFWLYVCVSV